MSTATATKCRAKNPSTCPHHGSPEVTAESMYQDFLKSQKTSSPPVDKNGAPVSAALKSSLVWNGEKPAWWDESVEKTESHKFLATTPELLDVIDSPVGKLAVVWQKESQEENDSGVTLDSGMQLNVCYFKSVETGKVLGYVKLSSITEESTERSFGDDEFSVFRWASRYESLRGFNSWDDDEAGYGERNLEGEALVKKRRELWVAGKQWMKESARLADGTSEVYYNISDKHVPEDDKVVSEDLARAAARLQKKQDMKAKYFETPYVDFSRIEYDLKGKGFGASLYIYAAKRLGQQGQVLRGSGIQSDDAEGLWGKFKKKLPDNVKNINLVWGEEKSVAPVLDFR